MAARQLQAAYDYDYAEDYAYGHDLSSYMPERAPKEETNEETAIKVNIKLRRRIVSLVMMCAVGAAVVLYGNQIVSSCTYNVVVAKQKAERLEQENEHLRVDIAKLKSHQRIKEIAIKKLGMVVPQKVYFATGNR